MIELDSQHDRFIQPLMTTLEVVAELFERQLASEFPAVESLCRHVSRYRGKMLRPTLTLLSGVAAMDGDIGVLESKDLRRLSAVFEMIHMATLVHDDVLDEADHRRGGETVNRLNDNETAVMLGDYLISNAFHLAATIGDADLTERIGRVTNTLCEGELIQLHHRDDLGLDLDTYLATIRRKTAVLVGACGRLGARVAGGSEATAAALGIFGEHLGVAFQIRDDVFDLEGETAVVGKSVGRDLAKGKLTLPMILLLDSAETRTFADAVDAFRRRDADAVLQLLREADATGKAISFANEQVETAKTAIEGLPLGGTEDLLRDLADSVVARSR
ncbi:MAG: polyprenyl synthetase family protein [Phycisphaera sp. TMED9]|nr:MAG: polyprenyl synthetase family protein [Phycisphaera sp. TMED9]